MSAAKLPEEGTVTSHVSPTAGVLAAATFVPPLPPTVGVLAVELYTTPPSVSAAPPLSSTLLWSVAPVAEIPVADGVASMSGAVAAARTVTVHVPLPAA